MQNNFCFVKSINYKEDAIGKCVKFNNNTDVEKWYFEKIHNNHSDWFEYFDKRYTKFYLDWDKEVNQEVNEEMIKTSYQLCKEKCDFITDIIYEKMGKDVKYYCATRTGNGYYEKYDKKNKCNKTGYKISLRFYFNFSILYTHIPYFLEKISQDKFWDINPYHKTNQKINLIGCIKSQYDKRILLPFNGFTFITNKNILDYVIQDTTNCTTEIEITEPINKSIETTPNNENKTKDYQICFQFLKNGLLSQFADDYRSWINIGLCLKTIFTEDKGLNLFHQFSSQSTKYCSLECDKVWNEFKPSGVLTFGTIRYYAKQTNEKIYFQIINKFNEKKFSDIFYGGSLDVIEYIREEIKNYVAFCNKNWYIFNEKTKCWEIQNNPKTFIVRICRKFLENELNEILNMNIDDKTQKIDKLNKIYKEIDQRGFKNNMEEHMKNILLDNKFHHKFDNFKGKLVFKNGILDLKTGMFQNGFTYSDLISETLDFNYSTNINPDDINWVKQRLKEICNNDNDDTEEFLSILGYTLTGYSDKEQCFFTLYGPSASNGKTLIFEVLTRIFSIYSKKIDKRTFLDGWAKSHKEIIHFKNKRFIWQDELPKKKIDVELIKDFINGISISVERLFDTNEDILLSGKLFILTNNSLKMDADNGIIRRTIILEFISKFYETPEEYEENKYNTPNDKKFIMNKNLLNEFLDKKEAFTYLLIQYAKKYFKNGLCINKKTKLNKETNEPELSCLINDKIITIDTNMQCDEYITSKKEITDVIDNNFGGKYSFNDIKDFLKSYNVIYDRRKFKGNRGDPRGCFIGIKLN